MENIMGHLHSEHFFQRKVDCPMNLIFIVISRFFLSFSLLLFRNE